MNLFFIFIGALFIGAAVASVQDGNFARSQADALIGIACILMCIAISLFKKK